MGLITNRFYFSPTIDGFYTDDGMGMSDRDMYQAEKLAVDDFLSGLRVMERLRLELKLHYKRLRFYAKVVLFWFR